MRCHSVRVSLSPFLFFSSIDVAFDIDADADEAQVEALIASATKYSAVFDMLTAPTQVTVG